MKSYNSDRCRFCMANGVERWISNAGFAYGRHMQVHELNGEAVRNYWGKYVTPDSVPEDALPYEYVRKFRPELMEGLR